MNVMKSIRIEKVTLNIGAGKDQDKLAKGLKLLENLTSKKPVKTFTTKRIAGWGLRPGLPIGCKVTVRGAECAALLKNLLGAKDNILTGKQFDSQGNVAFGIHEYIDIPETKYDPDIGLLGLQVCVTLSRPGYRVKNRSLRSSAVPKTHRITRDESVQFFKDQFAVKLSEEMVEA